MGGVLGVGGGGGEAQCGNETGVGLIDDDGSEDINDSPRYERTYSVCALLLCFILSACGPQSTLHSTLGGLKL